eukprot:scaffold12817_cov75-Phaeocystis_antarctica.AAC.2
MTSSICTGDGMVRACTAARHVHCERWAVNVRSVRSDHRCLDSAPHRARCATSSSTQTGGRKAGCCPVRA